jgi:glycosyltransferase involved in cell wall biosynthesis
MNDILLAVPMIGGANWLGGENYIRNILYSLLALPEPERPRVRLTSILNANPELVRSLIKLPFVEVHPFTRLAFHNSLSRIMLSVTVRLLRIFAGADYNLEYQGVDLIFPEMQYGSPSERAIYWISDFQEIHLPELFTPEGLSERHQQKSKIIESRNVVVLSSNDAADDVQHNFRTINAKVRVWHFCSFVDRSRHGRDPQEAFELPQKFAYVANQFWAHKNYETAFKALALLKARGLRLPLACTGSSYEPRIKNHYERLMAMLSDLEISDQVHLLGIVPREDQIELMRHAAFVVQPSLFEGWSTVVEDAISLGRPLVVSNLKVHREQNPADALFFDPHDAEDMAEKLRQAWESFGPGPNSEMERAAEQRHEQRRLEAGRAFVAILEEAMQTADSAE